MGTNRSVALEVSINWSTATSLIVKGSEVFSTARKAQIIGVACIAIIRTAITFKCLLVFVKPRQAIQIAQTIAPHVVALSARLTIT